MCSDRLNPCRSSPPKIISFEPLKKSFLHAHFISLPSFFFKTWLLSKNCYFFPPNYKDPRDSRQEAQYVKFAMLCLFPLLTLFIWKQKYIFEYLLDRVTFILYSTADIFSILLFFSNFYAVNVILVEKKEGISPTTTNYYCTSCIQFCWKSSMLDY